MSCRLTPMEIRILCMIADGIETKDIARRNGCSVKTVEAHRFNIYTKLGIHKAVETVHFAIWAGLRPVRRFDERLRPEKIHG